MSVEKSDFEWQSIKVGGGAGVDYSIQTTFHLGIVVAYESL